MVHTAQRLLVARSHAIGYRNIMRGERANYADDRLGDGGKGLSLNGTIMCVRRRGRPRNEINREAGGMEAESPLSSEFRQVRLITKMMYMADEFGQPAIKCGRSVTKNVAGVSLKICRHALELAYKENTKQAHIKSRMQ